VALLVLTPYHFFRHWLVDGNALNGIPGFAWAFMLTATSVLKHLRVHELQGQGESPDGAPASPGPPGGGRTP
jgi:hypothetical protein